jgi:SHS2 domain-containing protein
MRKKPDPGWILLDHTADIRMEVRGTDLEELFANAAIGMTRLIAEESEVGPESELEFSLKAYTVEELLVDWLRELLFVNQTTGFILIQPKIVEVSRTVLKARILGRIKCPDEKPLAEIKAVTYHGLSVQVDDRGYSAKIVFDI